MPQLAFCWSRARRKLYDIHVATKPPLADEALRRIASLSRSVVVLFEKIGRQRVDNHLVPMRSGADTISVVHSNEVSCPTPGR